jgi:NAD(P) transhydrogenase subunit alpha
MALLIGVPKETAAGEKRVATVPDVVEKLVKLGFRWPWKAGRAMRPTLPTTPTVAAGAQIVPTAAELWARADFVFKVRGPQHG